MALSIGIVGLPNVGKSTLFTALTRKSVLIANYPFATIDPSVGVVAVPDERLDALAKLSKSEKVIPAAVEFVDIAGLVKGASAGEGLGNKFLANIRETDAIAQVVRIFEDDNIIHVDGKIDPVRNIEVINLELIIADRDVVAKRIANLGRDVKAGKKEAMIVMALVERLAIALDAGQLASTVVPSEIEEPYYRQLHLLTAKPILYVLNKKSGGVNLDETRDARWEALMNYISAHKARYVIVDAGTEHDLKDMSDTEKQEMRQGLGSSNGIDDLIRGSYELLGLITYFTTGEKETRGWTIKKGWTAPLAGTAIHNDFKDKFIRAEVVYWKDLIDSGSYSAAREKGLVRTEGKEYIVKDGDVMEFRV